VHSHREVSALGMGRAAAASIPLLDGALPIGWGIPATMWKKL
jgi:hypothetical protein